MKTAVQNFGLKKSEKKHISRKAIPHITVFERRKQTAANSAEREREMRSISQSLV